MTKRRTYRVPALFAALLLAACALLSLSHKDADAASSSDLRKQINSLQDEYNRALSRKQEVQSRLAVKRAQIVSKMEEKQALDEEITVLTEELMITESLIDEYTAYIEEKENEKAELDEKQKEQSEMLGSMLRLSYQYSDESYIDLILGAGSISDFLQRLDFLSYHMKYSSTLLAEMNETMQSLSEITENLGNALDAQQALKESKEALRAELEIKFAEAERILAALMAEEDAYEKELNQRESDRLALERDVRQLTAQLAAQEAAERAKNQGSGGSKAPTGGKLGWPLNGYSLANKSSDYGSRVDPITGKLGAFHNGLDIAVPYATKILAAEAGTVTRASVYGSYGNCVIINHGGGLMTLYAHCSGYNVTVGQEVEKGEVIAYVGSTGRSTGNHLHFTVFQDGVTQNPINYLK